MLISSLILEIGNVVSIFPRLVDIPRFAVTAWRSELALAKVGILRKLNSICLDLILVFANNFPLVSFCLPSKCFQYLQKTEFNNVLCQEVYWWVDNFSLRKEKFNWVKSMTLKQTGTLFSAFGFVTCPFVFAIHNRISIITICKAGKFLVPLCSILEVNYTLRYDGTLNSLFSNLRLNRKWNRHLVRQEWRSMSQPCKISLENKAQTVILLS